MDPYATHVPVTALALVRTAEIAPGLPILECGCGDYSSPMIHLLKGGREHHIYSSDPLWSDRFTDIADRIVKIEPVQPHKWGKWYVQERYGLCLMDSEELVVHRAKQIPRLLDGCLVVVMHDARASMLGTAEYEYLYNRYSPWTWIGSNSFDVRQWFDD